MRTHTINKSRSRSRSQSNHTKKALQQQLTRESIWNHLKRCFDPVTLFKSSLLMMTIYQGVTIDQLVCFEDLKMHQQEKQFEDITGITKSMMTRKLTESAYRNVIATAPCNMELLEFVMGGETDPDSFFTICKDESHLYVTFRGTSSIREGIEDFEFIPVDLQFKKFDSVNRHCNTKKQRNECEQGHSSCKWQHNVLFPDYCYDETISKPCLLGSCPTYTQTESTIKVHEGFLDKYNDMRSLVIPRLEKQMKRFPTHDVIVIGQSLGASLAVLCTLDLKLYFGHQLQHKLSTYVFGCPNVGNREFVKYYNAILPLSNTWRVIDNRDIVNNLAFMYHHVGTVILIGHEHDDEQNQDKLVSIKASFLDHCWTRYILGIYFNRYDIISFNYNSHPPIYSSKSKSNSKSKSKSKSKSFKG